jgi:hypothetical protein
MRDHEAQIYQDILQRMTARYLTVRPTGIEIPDQPERRTHLDVKILNHGAARTLYRGQRPVCRSLNGIQAMGDANKHCAACPAQAQCTPQVRVELLFEGMPYRLLLSFTSAKNFILYLTLLHKRRLDLQTVKTRIRVANRGSWGELRFDLLEDRSRPPAATPEPAT